MSRLTTTRQLLRRHAASFAISFAALTTVLLAHFATRRVPGLSTRGAPAGTVAEMLLLALPFIAAMTIPIAILVTVLHEFTRLRTDGTLAAARRERGGVRRLVLPVLAAAVGVAALTLVSNTELLPRANARLATVLAGRTEAPTDRTMTIGELRAAARVARADAGPRARSAAAVYEVEVQKKYALAAACVVLALRVPRGGAGLVIGASGAVVGAYYVLLVTGEQLAERLVVSPFVAMWGANAVLLAAASLALWRRRPPAGSGGRRTVVLRG
jgi:lipopolysaccharide export LptBFGC system permease protein LptF